MDASIESRVDREVEAWLRWVPRWRPGTHRARSRLCQHCFGSPVLRAAGLDTDVPHAVQHPLSMRMKTLVEYEVETYTAQSLPLLNRELASSNCAGPRRRTAHSRASSRSSTASTSTRPPSRTPRTCSPSKSSCNRSPPTTPNSCRLR